MSSKCNCGGYVASNARVCPHCGYRFMTFGVKVFLFLLGMFVILCTWTC